MKQNKAKGRRMVENEWKSKSERKTKNYEVNLNIAKRKSQNEAMHSKK